MQNNNNNNKFIYYVLVKHPLHYILTCELFLATLIFRFLKYFEDWHYCVLLSFPLKINTRLHDKWWPLGLSFKWQDHKEDDLGISIPS